MSYEIVKPPSNGWAFNTNSLEAASAHFKSPLAGKAVLLLLDDAWDAADVCPFLVGGRWRTVLNWLWHRLLTMLGVKQESLAVNHAELV